MKKTLFSLAAILFSILILSCKDEKVEVKKSPTPKKQKNVQVAEYKGNPSPLNFDEAFMPDYSVIVPEEATSVRLTAGIDTRDGSSLEGIVPKIRDLSKYKTKYDTKFDTTTYMEAKIENVPSANSRTPAIAEDDTSLSKEVEIKILYMYPGWTKEKPYIYSNETGLLPNQPQQVWLSLSEEATIEEFESQYQFVSGKWKCPHKIELLDIDGNPIEDNNRSKYMLVKITGKVDPNIILKFAGVTEKKFIYLNYFKSKDVSRFARNSGDKKNLITITFTHEVDSASLSDSAIFIINTESGEEIPVRKNNLESFGNTISVFNINLVKGQTYKIKIDGDVKDIFGQSLNNPSKFYDVKPPRDLSYVNYLDSGVKILEAQFPPKLLIEYMNIYEDSTYGIRKIGADENIYSIEKAAKIKNLDYTKRNVRMFEEIPLDEYLENGKGFIQFNADVKYDYYSWWNDKTERESATNNLTLQVTDIGVTARISINKVVALVTSLETGKPIESAKVEFRNAEKESKISNGNFFGEAISDKKWCCCNQYKRR